MPTRNVSLTVELDRFVAHCIESGRYENASEVVRAALRGLNQEERKQEHRLTTPESQRFCPVPVRGEPLSTTLLKDRGVI